MQKLDLLMEVVNGMNTRIQEQDERLQKQEERVGLRDVSALPSAHSSPKASKNTAPDRVPSFEELRTTPEYKQRSTDICKLITTPHESTTWVSQILL